MATNIFNFDGTLLTTVADGTLDQTHASIKIPGRGYQNYGEPVMESLLWVMQNFAGSNEPPHPSTGQLWYDTTQGNNVLKVWTGTDWVTAGGVIASDTAPDFGANQGAFWYDTRNKQMNTWNGTNWDIVGPLGSKINNDPRDPSVPVNSAIEAMSVIAQEDGQPRQVWRITVGGQMLAILSKDQVFTPQSQILTANGFGTIYPGINFNSTISGIGVAGDSTIFKSTQTNLPSSDAVWDLGSPTRKFNNIFGASGIFSGGLGVNVTPSQYAFQVNGTSKFDKLATFATGTRSYPPVKLPSGLLTSTPQLGSIEFDGNNFYFTGLLNGSPVRQQPVFNSNTINSNSLYVSSKGDDTNDGRSRTSPYKTIKRAVQYVIDNNLSGYSIFVESGEYLEQNPIYVPPRTSIVGDNLRRVIVRPVHDHLDIFHVDVGTYFYGMTFKEHRSPAFCFAFPCSLAKAQIEDDILSPYYGQVKAIFPMYSQTGYDPNNPPEVFIEAPGYFSGGQQAIASAVVVNGAITDVVVTAGGLGYSYGNPPIVQISGFGGSGTGAAATARVNESGQVVAIDITDPGQDYVAPISVSISGGAGTGASATAVVGDGVIRSYYIPPNGGGSGYTAENGFSASRLPWISIKPVVPAVITSSPYVQNCSSITGPFDTYGRQIPITFQLPWDDSTLNAAGYGDLDPTGAGAGIRVDGEVVNNDPVGGTVIRSFVADSFTQINQGGIGHLIINRGYAQFVSCFTTFSSVGYWARGGGFANISNSVIDFGDIGLKAEGYYPVAYATGTVTATASSGVLAVTLTNTGSNYSSDFDIVIGAPDLPGGVQAEGVARIDPVTKQVNSVQITVNGSGYTTPPAITFPPQPGVTDDAAGYALLLYPDNVPINKDTAKPQFSSGMMINGQIYKVTDVTEDANNWLVVAVDQNGNNVPYYNVGASIAFHDISNISTGGLALEYVGSGVTYNALPRYGGIPDESKQVVDGKTDSYMYPGRVYYVTISSDGNFKIGPYFAVNFIDGTVTLNANQFNLANLRQIGPFSGGGTYATEISLDPSLTHLGMPSKDQHTLPTQSAVRGFMQQISSDVLPNATNLRNIGNSTYRWNAVTAASLAADSGQITAVNSTTVSATVVNATNLNATVGAVSGSLTVAGPVAIAGNLTVTGNTFLFNTNTYVISDTVIDIGTAPNNQPLPSDDGKDRGFVFHYYNNAPVRGESAGDNHAFLGMRDSTHELIFATNIQPGTSNVAVPVDLTYAVWGNVQVGSVTVNGDINATGDITGFYLSPSDSQLKTNLEPITDALDKVKSLNGFTFDWNETARSTRPNRTRREAGVIAQEVEKVLPEVVSNGIHGYKSVDYDKLVPLLIEAIKELTAKVDRLEKGK